MKLLFDQNISFRILQMLPDEFQGSSHVRNVNLTNAIDREIWDFAKKNDFIIVTQDSDFIDLNFLFGFPPKIIWIRTGNLSTGALSKILKQHLEDLRSFSEHQEYGCFEIARFMIP